MAGLAHEFTSSELRDLFEANFHVHHRDVFENQKERLVLVKGSSRSRLLQRAVPLSALGRDRAGRPLHVLSPEMRKIFGEFDGKLSVQRSPTRWVDPTFVTTAAAFLKSLP